MSRSTLLGMFVLLGWAACGGGGGGTIDAGLDGSGPNDGLPVGSPCTMASQCESPTSPECLTNVKPLASLAGVSAELADLGLEFPDGYCSSVLNCSGDADCGALGACYRPFRDVTPETLRELEPPLGVTEGTLDFLPAYGVCLRTCTSVADCETGQLCEPPLQDFIMLVPGSINDTSYCVPDPACPPEGCSSGPDREIGEACTSDDQCDVRGTPRCMTEIHPLMAALPPTELLANIGLDFPRGYCSNEPNCAANIDCGDKGKCLAPFRDVTSETFRELENTFDPPLTAGALDFLGGYGVCLRECTDGFDCFSDQACQLVMDEFIDQVPGSVNSQTFCVPHADCRFCSSHAHCVVDANDDGACVCDPGYSGNGLTCTATGGGACEPNPCQHGGTCTEGTDGAYTCACPSGYSGTQCQISEACNPDPCQNGGVCGDGGACDCAGTGYIGATCTTPVDCGPLTAPQNGSVVTATTTLGSTATYACTGGFLLNGNATRTCEASGAWSGTAPTCTAQTDPCTPNPCQNGGTCAATGQTTFMCTCQPGYTGSTCATPAGCGTHTDVIYRLTATFAVMGTTFGIGDQTFTGLTNNATTTPFQSTTNTTPFVGSGSGGTFTRGFARLRFTNDAAGNPVAGNVRLVEWYVPLEFTQTAGATLYANNDHSVGILATPPLANCGAGDTTCTNHTPTVNRTCAANASGTLTGTTLAWGACTPAWTGANSWSYASSARSATGAGCAAGYVQYGNNTTSSGLIPASGKGDAYQVYNQQLANITFSGTSYATATWSMASIQIPNGTGQSNTWLTITGATPIATDCGTTPATDLVCNVQ